MWSPASGNVKSSDDKKMEKKFELQRQQLEKSHESAVLRLTILHLQIGDVDSARLEFMSLKNQEGLTEELVQTAYANKKVQLLELVKFVCRINIFSTTYTAINALFQEMSNKNQLQEIEIVALNFRIQTMMNEAKFALQTMGLKLSFQKLKSKISPHAQKITTSLVSDIAKGAFQRPKMVFEVQKNFQKGKDLFLADLVKQYLSSTNLSKQFSQLYNFVESLYSYKSACYMYGVLWQELKASGSGNTMEALVVWIRASEISQYAKTGNLTGAHPCTEVSNITAPEYKQTLVTNYKNYIKNGELDVIQELHKTYRMAFFFSDYINTLSSSGLQNAKFTKLVEAVNALHSIYDTCAAAGALYQKLKKSDMRGTFEHFQTLQIVKNIKAKPNYANSDTISRSKCEGVMENIPQVFQKLLYGDTSNCKLLNRFYKDEPLYCTGIFHLDELEYKKIYTGAENSDDADRYWNVTVPGNKTHGVGLESNFDSSFRLRYIFDNVRAIAGALDVSLDFFRIHIVENVYVQLEPISKNVFVGVGSKTCDTNKRCVEMLSDPTEKRTHWKFICY